MGIHAAGQVPAVFRVQGPAVVFQMTGHEDLGVIQALHQGQARLVGFGQDAQVGRPAHVFGADFGVARMRRREVVVEAAEQAAVGVQDLVAEDARTLFRQFVLGHTVKVVQGGLGGPADVERGEDMPVGVGHDVQQFLPVVHLFEGQMLHGSPGDDHAVEAAVADLAEGLVETLQMLQGRILGLMLRRAQQGDVDLQGRVAQQAQQLCLGGDLGGHEVDDHDVQRTDVLADGAFVGHDKDVFTFQSAACRQVGGNLDGHGFLVGQDVFRNKT